MKIQIILSLLSVLIYFAKSEDAEQNDDDGDLVVREEWIKIVTYHPKNETDSVSKFADIYNDYCQTNNTADASERFFTFLKDFLRENSNFEEVKPSSKTTRSFDDEEVPPRKMTRTYGYSSYPNTAPQYSYNYGSAARPRPVKPAPAKKKNVNVSVNVKKNSVRDNTLQTLFTYQQNNYYSPCRK